MAGDGGPIADAVGLIVHLAGPGADPYRAEDERDGSEDFQFAKDFPEQCHGFDIDPCRR